MPADYRIGRHGVPTPDQAVDADAFFDAIAPRRHRSFEAGKKMALFTGSAP
jgi:hypothetical protein